MALVAHFPLNKNSENYVGIGYKLLKDEEMTFVKGGKIGKCAQFDGNAFLSGELDDGVDEEFSFTFWIKVDILQTSTVRYILAKNTNDYASSNFEYGIYIPANYKVLKIIVYGKGFDTNVKPEQGEWIHIAVTFKNNIVKMYKDGIKVYEGISTAIKYKKKYLCIGARSNNDSGTTGYGRLDGVCLNDVRVYNHCLSLAEIKKLNRALVLHYPFDYPILNPAINTTPSQKIDISNLFNGQQNVTKLVAIIPYSKNYIYDGNYLTFSFDIMIKGLTFAPTTGNTEYSIRFHDHTKKVDGTDVWCALANDVYEIKNRSHLFANRGNVGDRIDLTKDGVYHIERTFLLKNTSVLQNREFDVILRCDGISGGEGYISNFSVVVGKEDISHDYTGKTVYDVSGMKMDGELKGKQELPLTNVKTFSNDSKVGSGCYVSATKTNNGDDQYQLIETIDNFEELPEITISFWVYKTKYMGGHSNGQEETYVAVSPNAENYCVWIRTSGSENSVVSASLWNVNLLSKTILKNDVWTHVVVTGKKGNEIKIYINGKLDNIGLIPDSTKAWESHSLTVGELRLGRDMRFDGKMDDLRIYASILNDKEIKRLYEEKAKVDNKGNLYCSELVEKTNLEYNIFDFAITTPAENDRYENSNAITVENSLVFSSENGDSTPRYYRCKMFLRQGVYKIFKTYQIIGDNFTSTTGRFHIGSLDWSKEYIVLGQKDAFGTMEIEADQEVYLTFVASESNSNTNPITVQFNLSIIPNKYEIDNDVKVLNKYQIKTYELIEKNSELTKIYNKNKVLETNQLNEN